MDEILKKDIFNDEVLLKLSPDFKPSDLILRMQTRRSLIKDTHCHRIHKYYNMQKRERLKNVPKVSKEIMKLKNKFQTENLKNNIRLKHAITKTKDIAHIKKDVENFNIDNLDNIPTLVINTSSISSDDNEILKYEEIEGINLNNTEDIGFHLESLNITAFNDPKDDVNDYVDMDSEVDSAKLFVKRNNKELLHADSNIKPSKVNDMVGDLQPLFIQLAITSYSSEDDSTKDGKENIENNDNMPVTEVNESFTLDDVDLILNKDLCDDFNFLSVSKINPIINIRDKYLMRKYIQKWRMYTKNKSMELKEKRETVINNFLKNLEKKKNKVIEKDTNKATLLAKDHGTYQHRYKVQKHIIAFQKAKLEEQNRIIEELKYNKILDASKKSVEEMKEEVRKSYFEIDRQLKPKIKCLTKEFNIPEIEEPALILHCLKVPQFLQRMEKRARKREEKHAITRERRRQMEEEKIRIKQQAELAKLEMDKEEKTKHLKELKERRKRERIEAIRKKEHADRMRALTVMAELHYERVLLTKYGMEPWKLLLKIKKINIEKAKRLRRLQLLRRVFQNWMWYTDDQVIERNFIAEEFYRKRTLAKYFVGFKMNLHEFMLKKQVAEDYYDFYLTRLVFSKFCEAVKKEKEESERKMEIAIAYYKSSLKFRIISRWRTLPAINRLLREQDLRKTRWRMKVLEVVPDFVPPEN